MMHNNMTSFLFKIAWWISALAAIHIGATAFGYDIFAQHLLMNQPHLINPIKYVVGIAGILSVISLLSFAGKDSCCQ